VISKNGIIYMRGNTLCGAYNNERWIMSEELERLELSVVKYDGLKAPRYDRTWCQAVTRWFVVWQVNEMINDGWAISPSTRPPKGGEKIVCRPVHESLALFVERHVVKDGLSATGWKEIAEVWAEELLYSSNALWAKCWWVNLAPVIVLERSCEPPLSRGGSDQGQKRVLFPALSETESNDQIEA